MRILYKTCPLCDSKGIGIYKEVNCTKHGLYNPKLEPLIRWLQCVECNHMFTNGYWGEYDLSLIFSKTQACQIVGYDTEGQRFVSARIIDKLLPYQNQGRWLDIGFGNGSLLMTAKEYGFEPVGLDLRPDNVEAMKGLGIKAYQLDISNFITQNLFNVISMCDVLEHIPFPKDALQQAHKFLNTNGILFLSMPNMESIIWNLLPENPYWSEIEHFHNFSRTILYELLKETGFTPIKYGISERYRLCMEVIAVKK